MSVSCQILLNRPREGMYCAGNEVTGTIKYAINEPLEVNDITLSLVGEAFCQWVAHGPLSRHTIYTGKEEVISIKENLLEKTTSTVTLQRGAYDKQFSFTLPYNIPPTYEDKNSFIKYLVKLKFSRPGKFKSAKRFQTEIKVKSDLDPNTSEELVVFGIEKNLIKLFSGKKNNINLRAELPKSYSPSGQSASVKIFIKNDADVTIPSIKTELFSKTVYTAKRGRTKESIHMFKESTIDSPPVYNNTEANLLSCINIPPGLYSVQNSKVVSKQFFIRITLNLPFLHMDSFVDMPITIGEKRTNTIIQEDDKFDDQCLLHKDKDIDGQKVEQTRTDEPPSYWEVMQEDL